MLTLISAICLVHISMSAVNRVYIIGLNIPPCGTPDVSFIVSESDWPILTLCVYGDRKKETSHYKFIKTKF